MNKIKVDKYLTLLVFWLLVIIGCLIWQAVIFFTNWEVVLTPKQKFFLYWKPALIQLIAAFFFNFNIEMLKRK